MSEASTTSFIVGNLVPWSEHPFPLSESGPFETGAVYDSSSRKDCFIRNVSPLGATLIATLNKYPGDHVSVELGNGRRSAGKVAWIAGGEVGVSFSEPIDVLALINRSLVAQPAERRRMPRVELRCAVHLKYGCKLGAAALRNISAGGLQIEGDELPPRGTFVSVFIEGLIVPAGEVVWQRSNLAGIELFEELSWTSIMPWIRAIMGKLQK